MDYIPIGTTFRCEKTGYLFKVSDYCYNSFEEFQKRIVSNRAPDQEFLICEILHPIKDVFYMFYTGNKIKHFSTRDQIEEFLKISTP